MASNGSSTIYRGEFANRQDAGQRLAKALTRYKDQRPVVLAVPVAPHEAVQTLAAEADDMVCLLSPTDFHSVAFYYADFTQTTDEEVIELLQRQ